MQERDGGMEAESRERDRMATGMQSAEDSDASPSLYSSLIRKCKEGKTTPPAYQHKRFKTFLLTTGKSSPPLMGKVLLFFAEKVVLNGEGKFFFYIAS